MSGRWFFRRWGFGAGRLTVCWGDLWKHLGKRPWWDRYGLEVAWTPGPWFTVGFGAWFRGGLHWPQKVSQ